MSTNYLSAEQRGTLQYWLDESSELFIEVSARHTGAAPDTYFITKSEQLEELVEKTHAGACSLTVCIFRGSLFSVRGVADETLLSRALSEIPDGQWGTVIPLERAEYPNSLVGWGFSCHEELKAELPEDFGQQVAIGQNPFDNYSTEEVYAWPADKAMVLHPTEECEQCKKKAE